MRMPVLTSPIVVCILWAAGAPAQTERYVMTADADVACWKRVGGPLDAFTVNTSFDVRVTCRHKPRRSMAETQRKLEDDLTAPRSAATPPSHWTPGSTKAPRRR